MTQNSVLTSLVYLGGGVFGCLSVWRAARHISFFFFQGPEGSLSGQDNKCEALSLFCTIFAMTHYFSVQLYALSILYSDKTERYFFSGETLHPTDVHPLAEQSLHEVLVPSSISSYLL